MNEGGGLYERELELELLDQMVHGALDGDAVLALLEGPAGIGKSSLLARTREAASASGFRVLSVLGDYQGGPWDARADVWVILARKR